MTTAPASLRTPRTLWTIALVALVPAVLPLIFLFGRVAGSTSAGWETLWSMRTLSLLITTLWFTAVVTATAATLGVAAAWITTRTSIRFRRIWMVLATVPLVLPSYVLALALLSMFGPRGVLSDITGFAIPSVSGFVGAWSALTLSTYPYVYLVTVAALRRIDPAQEEAARGLGASPLRAFATIVLPQLRPAIAAGSLLVALYTLSDFGAVSLMRFDVLTRVIYAQYQGRLDRTPAAVLSVVLIVVAIAVLVAERRTRGRASYFSRRPSRSAHLITLTPGAETAATGFMTLLAFASLGLPVITLIGWIVRGNTGGNALIDWGALGGSVAGSIGAAVVAMVLSAPLAVLAVRHATRSTRWLERVVYAIFAIPHITTALAVVFFASRYLGGLYQSLSLLIIVYASLFLAQAFGSARSSLVQVNPHLEEAARGLGKGPLRTMWDITVPLIWKGMLVGGALVFLTTMKELPATLLLRPTGFDTLAVEIWAAADELAYARAAAPALLLVAVSAIPMYVISARSDTAATP